MTAPRAAASLDPALNDLRAWLGQWRDLVVGKTADFCNCPIANWLRSLGYKRVSVTGTTALVDGVIVVLPAWIVSYIGKLDDAFGYGESVTGREALGVLDEIAGAAE